MRSAALILLVLMAAATPETNAQSARASQSFQVIVVPRVKTRQEGHELKINSNVALVVQIDDFQASAAVSPTRRTTRLPATRTVKVVPAEPFVQISVSTEIAEGTTLRVVTVSSLH